jgi:ribose 5-phosphate isomerase B
MKIALGSDHAGFELKQKVHEHLEKDGFQVNDLGTTSTESVDYPDFAQKVAHEVAQGRSDFGVLVCGSGIGMSITANKVAGIRAANVSDEQDARLSREHNNANVLAIGARIIGEEKAMKLVDIFLNTSFAGGRHERRVEKIAKIEEEECKAQKA